MAAGVWASHRLSGAPRPSPPRSPPRADVCSLPDSWSHRHSARTLHPGPSESPSLDATRYSGRESTTHTFHRRTCKPHLSWFVVTPFLSSPVRPQCDHSWTHTRPSLQTSRAGVPSPPFTSRSCRAPGSLMPVLNAPHVITHPAAPPLPRTACTPRARLSSHPSFLLAAQCFYGGDSHVT